MYKSFHVQTSDNNGAYVFDSPCGWDSDYSLPMGALCSRVFFGEVIFFAAEDFGV